MIPVVSSLPDWLARSNPAYEIGDLILADRCIQYDIDASELGFPAGTIPYTEYHTFTPDDALLKQAEQIETICI